MSTLSKIVVVLLVLTVLVIFASPFATLDPTALRAARAALACLIALNAFIIWLTLNLGFIGFTHNPKPILARDSDIHRLSCSLLI